ncbi:MucR family transcriptional regulator [Salinarimonas ramus]|uniref:Transcriptional regulator n=1 Tax=Salinarimonas ramus TaxID=690164 RepID=A0A917Q5Q0_9HYPH|nr:MucR family transcriptional regulator [Salinarimonas ramus]GGK28425.1 transcriptional regulator [Salinarimonas ramus]
MSEQTHVTLAASIVIAYVSNNPVPAAQLPELLGSVHRALVALKKAAEEPVPSLPPVPAVPVRKSITPDYIICLEDGKHCRSMKRHLMTAYGLTPDQYREKWGLPSDYPMVAPNYSALRSQRAKEIGLGQKRTTTAENRVQAAE